MEQITHADRQENVRISNNSFGTRVLNSKRFAEPSQITPQFKLIPIDRAALLRANKDYKNFYIMQDPANMRLIVFDAKNDHLITDFIGIYAPASPDCIYPDANSPHEKYCYAKLV